MKKTIVLGTLAAAAFSLLSATAVFAQEDQVQGRPDDNFPNRPERDFRFGTSSRPETDRPGMRLGQGEDRPGLRLGENEDMRRSTTTDDATSSRPIFRSTAGMSPDQIKAEIEARKEALAEKRASTTMEIKAKAMMNRLSETLKNVGAHFSAELKRLGEIETKIESRLTKLSAAGADVTTAQADLSLATAALQSAQTASDSFGSTDFSNASSTVSVRDAAKGVQSSIIAAQKALMKVVEDMAAAQETVRAEATSTQEAGN